MNGSRLGLGSRFGLIRPWSQAYTWNHFGGAGPKPHTPLKRQGRVFHQLSSSSAWIKKKPNLFRTTSTVLGIAYLELAWSQCYTSKQ